MDKKDRCVGRTCLFCVIREEKNVKKGQIFEGTIQKVIFPNKGIIKIEEREVVVKDGIQGQVVQFMIQKVRKGKCEGRILEVRKKADYEIQPSCPHFGMCGGCTYQNLSYDDQLQMKKEQVKALLDDVCETYKFEGIKGSPKVFGYRNKMEFSFGDEYKEGPLSLGMHKKGSFYDILAVDQCKIADEDFGKILRCVLEEAKKLNLPYYHKLSHKGYFRHLLVRKGIKSNEILVDLVTSTQARPNLNQMKEKILELNLKGTVVGILHTENDSLADVIRNDRTEILYGQDYFDEELLGLNFKISPFSFFQTNSLGAEVLYETVREYVGSTKDKVIFDLYSGTGTIAQMLAPVAKKVIGVEIVEEAVEAAKENAKRNSLQNCEFIAGDVLKVIDVIEEKPDLIVLDPPRDGIHPKALEKIIAYGVDHLVYISCKPTSLARDLEVLQARGYQVERVCCVDMFPGTVHVETVALLSKLKTDKHIEVELEMDELGRCGE